MASHKSGIACKACRRRGRKCDRTLPRCMSCHGRGIECEGYPLRWVGPAAGGKTVVRTYDGPVLRGQQAKLLEGQYHARQYGSSSGDVTLRRPTWEMPAPLLPPDGLQVFIKCYKSDISTAFYLGHGPAETPYTHHILPMARNVPCIRYAVAATACCHIGNKLQDKRLRMQSLQLRLEATQALRQQLRDDARETDVSLIACMILLAQLDLCSGDCLEFGTHLKAASDMVKRHGSDGSDRGFFQQRLAWLDIMGATTSSRMPHLKPEHVQAALNKFKTPSGRKWGFDVFDCPIDLFEYIADITVLHKLHISSQIPSDEALQKAVILGNAVRTWNGSGILPDQRQDMIEIWRYGILLYLIRLFQLSDEISDTLGLLDNVFWRAEKLSSGMNRKFSTSWPLFQAGLCLRRDSHERRQWLRKEFTSQFRTLGCWNPKLAIDVLDQFWQTGDKQNLELQTLLF